MTPPARLSADSADKAVDETTRDRALIDELDARIVELLHQRVEISHRIQQRRVSGGDRRIAHSRELQVLAHYTDHLGREAGAVAMAVLQLCRGASASLRSVV